MTMTRGRRHTLAKIAHDHYIAGKSERDALDDTLAGKKIDAEDRRDIELELTRMIEGCNVAPTEPDAPALAVVPDADGSVEAEEPIDIGVEPFAFTLPGAITAVTVQLGKDGDPCVFAEPPKTAVEIPLGARLKIGDSVFVATVRPGGILWLADVDDPHRYLFAGGPNGGPIVAPPGSAERKAEIERIATGAAARSPRRTPAQRLPDAEADFARASEAFARIAMLSIADMLGQHVDAAPFARMIKATLGEGLAADAITFVDRAMRARGYHPRHIEHIHRRIVDLVEAPAMLISELLAITPEQWHAETAEVVVGGTRLELPAAIADALGKGTEGGAES